MRPGRAAFAGGVLTALALIIALTGPLHAQDYPSRTVKLVVPFGPGGPTDVAARLVTQQVQLSFPDISILLPLIRAHKVKALAVTSARRHPQLPDVPTPAESGFPDFAITFWSGVVAPAGTPAAIVDKLNAAIDAGLRSREIEEKLAAIGAQTAPGSPQDFARFIAEETVKWRAIAGTAGVSLD